MKICKHMVLFYALMILSSVYAKDFNDYVIDTSVKNYPELKQMSDNKSAYLAIDTEYCGITDLIFTCKVDSSDKIVEKDIMLWYKSTGYVLSVMKVWSEGLKASYGDMKLFDIDGRSIKNPDMISAELSEFFIKRKPNSQVTLLFLRDNYRAQLFIVPTPSSDERDFDIEVRINKLR